MFAAEASVVSPGDVSVILNRQVVHILKLPHFHNLINRRQQVRSAKALEISQQVKAFH